MCLYINILEEYITIAYTNTREKMGKMVSDANDDSFLGRKNAWRGEKNQS